MIRPASMRQTGALRPAALLLEIVVALTIMTAAMAIVGAQLVSGLQFTGYADAQTRAGELADRIMSLLELDPTTAERIFTDHQADGDFGLQYPGFLWRVYVEPTEVVGLGQVTVQILYQPDPEKYSDIESAGLVRELHLLKADPGRIDLARDFGVAQEQIDLLAGSVQIPGFDPNNLDPQAIASLDPATLMDLLPQLIPLITQLVGNAGGADALNGMQNMSPEQLQQMIEDGLRQSAGLGAEATEGNPGGDVQMPGGGRPGGARGGRSGSGGKEQGGATTLEDLKAMGEGVGPKAPGGGGGRNGSGGRNAGGGGNSGGRTGDAGAGGQGGRGGRGGRNGGGGRSGQQPPMTLDDLNRVRDELQQQAGTSGGGKGGRGGRNGGGGRGGRGGGG